LSNAARSDELTSRIPLRALRMLRACSEFDQPDVSLTLLRDRLLSASSDPRIRWYEPLTFLLDRTTALSRLESVVSH
jgi:hypothetical protein